MTKTYIIGTHLALRLFHLSTGFCYASEISIEIPKLLWDNSTTQIMSVIQTHCTKITNPETLILSDIKGIRNALHICFFKKSEDLEHSGTEGFISIEPPQIITARIVNNKVNCTTFRSISDIDTLEQFNALNNPEKISLNGNDQIPLISMKTAHGTYFYKPDGTALKPIFQHPKSYTSLIGNFGNHYWLCNGKTCHFFNTEDTIWPPASAMETEKRQNDAVGLQPQQKHLPPIYWAINDKFIRKFTANPRNGFSLGFMGRYKPHSDTSTLAQYEISQLIPYHESGNEALGVGVHKATKKPVLLNISLRHIPGSDVYVLNELIMPSDNAPITSLALVKTSEKKLSLYALTENQQEKHTEIHSTAFEPSKEYAEQKTAKSIVKTSPSNQTSIVPLTPPTQQIIIDANTLPTDTASAGGGIVNTNDPTSMPTPSVPPEAKTPVQPPQSPPQPEKTHPSKPEKPLRFFREPILHNRALLNQEQTSTSKPLTTSSPTPVAPSSTTTINNSWWTRFRNRIYKPINTLKNFFGGLWGLFKVYGG